MNQLKNTFREGSGFKLFFLSLILTGLGYGLYKGVQDNYLAEVVAMGEMDRGIAEFFRELPGLLMVVILAVLYTFSAERIYRIGAVIMLFGMGMLAVVPPTRVLVTVGICIFSLGEHIQLGMKSAITLDYARDGKGGQALGYTGSVNQIGTLAGFVLIILSYRLFRGSYPFRGVFAVSTAFLAGSLLLASFLKGSKKPADSVTRFYFRKKFTKYYMLEVFYGARKQVFLTFGPYVLILFYGANTAIISTLFAVTAVLGFFLSPVVGRIIDKLGYKIVMISDTLILVIVCFFYGFAHHIFPMNVAFVVCCINYVLDSIISLASMASNVYVQDISDSKEETRATISTGISVNHLITLAIALFGGWIWSTLGIETLFILSAVLGLANSAYAATIKTGKQPC